MAPSKGGGPEGIVFPIGTPALRERSEDLPEPAATIATQLAKSGRGEVRLHDDAIRALQAYPWSCAARRWWRSCGSTASSARRREASRRVVLSCPSDSRAS